MDKKAFGMRIRQMRQKRRLTLTALAKRAETRAAYLSDIEYGRAIPTVSVFVRLANALAVSADDLLLDELEVSATKVFDQLVDALQNLTPEQKNNADAVLRTYLKYICAVCSEKRH